MSKTIKSFLKEIITVTIGILIALYINNWNETRKDQNYIDQITASIIKELNETNGDIIEKLEKQKILIDSLDFYSSNPEVSLDEIIKKADGIYIATIKINSWKAISNSKIELMDYETVSTLADIEEQKELLRIKSEKLIDFIYSNYKTTSQDKKEFMKISMLEIVSTENSLKKDVEKIIQKQ